MNYIVLFIILSVLLIVHLLFYAQIRDGANQFLIFGVYFFYGLCTCIKEIECVTDFFEYINPGLSEIVFFMFVILDIFCIVFYLMHLLDSKIFRCGAGICMTLELATLFVTMEMWIFNNANYVFFFLLSILIVGGVSFVFTVIYFIRKWNSLSPYYRTLIIATCIMGGWFLFTIYMNLYDSKNLAACGIGICLYFFVYLVASFVEIYRRYCKGGLSADRVDKRVKNLTEKEKKILSVMSERNITSTKEISQIVSEPVIILEARIYRLMSKFTVRTREQLIEYYKKVNK